LDALVQVEYLDITRKGFSPKVFRVAKGTLIRFIVTTDDKPRAIRIEGIPREWQVVPDQKTSFEWYAIRLGKAKIKCTDNCGMKGLWGGATILVTQ
jgi:heme/copper-type cytochrome/quinol oxidase subunit 2